LDISLWNVRLVDFHCHWFMIFEYVYVCVNISYRASGQV
jgi:hypothetical protein